VGCETAGFHSVQLWYTAAGPSQHTCSLFQVPQDSDHFFLSHDDGSCAVLLLPLFV
jgi:hypothetical protein